MSQRADVEHFWTKYFLASARIRYVIRVTKYFGRDFQPRLDIEYCPHNPFNVILMELLIWSVIALEIIKIGSWFIVTIMQCFLIFDIIGVFQTLQVGPAYCEAIRRQGFPLNFTM